MCRLPRRMEPANVTMSLSMMGIMIEGSQREFLYEDGGVILAMAPRRGPVAGGTDVELSMRNARRHVGLQCVFDGRRVTPTSIGVSSVICKSPRHARGEVSVEVWSENGGLGAGGVTYTYTRVAEVVGVRPSMGPLSGGVTVEVHGTGFESSGDRSLPALCRFGDTEVVASVLSTGVMRCKSPTSSESVVHVAVSTNSKDFSTSSSLFAYVPEIQVLGAMPSWVAQGGNTQVTVYGNNFVDSPGIACRFARRLVVSAMWVSSSSVSVKVPALRTGYHAVDANSTPSRLASTAW